jgi:hypothetical protein
MSLPFDLRNFICLLRRQVRKRLCLAKRRTASRSFSRRSSLTSRDCYSLTRMPLALYFTSRRTHLEQRLEFSLSKTTHLVLFFSQLEQGNISKPKRLMRKASASRLRNFFKTKERLASILKEEKVGFYSTFHSNTLSD